jgi:hypothetical protein
MVVDIDEFLLLKEHDSIQDLLEAFANPQVVSFNWRIFGSSGQNEYADDLVVSRFTACAPEHHPVNRTFKSIWRNTVQVVNNGPHRPHFRTFRTQSAGCIRQPRRWARIYRWSFARGPVPNRPTYGPYLDIAQINHYVVKSRSEFEEKKVRGRGWKAGGESQGARHTNAFFIEYDRNEVVDNLAASRSSEVRRETFLLRRKFLEMHGCDLEFIRMSNLDATSSPTGVPTDQPCRTILWLQHRATNRGYKSTLQHPAATTAGAKTPGC